MTHFKIELHTYPIMQILERIHKIFQLISNFGKMSPLLIVN